MLYATFPYTCNLINKDNLKHNYLIVLLFICVYNLGYTQHSISAKLKVDNSDNTITILQEVIYHNNSNAAITKLFFNDWNNAFSSKNSALAKRFSDEYVRAFHLAKDEDRGYTDIKNISNNNFEKLTWKRNENQVDILEVDLLKPLLPNESRKFSFTYILKVPNARFTKYGFHNNGKIYLKNWLLTPCRFENDQFIIYSNENIDDITNAVSNYSIAVNLTSKQEVASNLLVTKEDDTHYKLNGNNITEVEIIFSPNKEFTTYKNQTIEVSSSIENSRLDEYQQAIVIDKITNFVAEKLGKSNVDKILISQEDYERQPFYGLNQLPAFLSPYPDQLMFELKFLKTYLNNYLKSNLKLNNRTEYWIADGIQVFTMMQFIDEFYPDIKMTGNLASFKLLKSYNFINIDFNQQYNYLYMLMARKNLDQPLNEPKNRLIKFNEQISSKYRSGLNFKYLDSYLENDIVATTIKDFISINKSQTSNAYEFEKLLKSKTHKNINWFFDTLIETRDLIDFKFGKVKKNDETVTVTIKNKTKTNIPISFYELKNDSVVYKKWIENIKTDTTLVFPRNNADKLTLNYFNEIPEYNLRNNWKSLKGFFFNNRPIKFNFYKDLEEPYYNQIFYVPEFSYNLYDGISIGMKLDNKSILNKPFVFSIYPTYSTNTKSLVGGISTALEQNIRNNEIGKLYKIKYGLSASTSHYTQDANYTNISPYVLFLFRDENLRTNKNEYIQLKQLYIDREKSEIIIDKNTESYTVFNAKYGNNQSETTKTFSLATDLQVANSFGKFSSEISYSKLFENNRRISIRLYAGTFLYRSTASDFFSFGLDKPTDYLFQYGNLLGRSETTGLYSQQYIYAEGGFKSKLKNRYANQWMVTTNAAFNIWNWIQVYGDIGFIKSKYHKSEFVYDSGVHLNLVPDYFELFFPVYSSNGYELNDPNYGENIRFVITISPKTLISLFTRKWF